MVSDDSVDAVAAEKPVIAHDRNSEAEDGQGVDEPSIQTVDDPSPGGFGRDRTEVCLTLPGRGSLSSSPAAPRFGPTFPHTWGVRRTRTWRRGRRLLNQLPDGSAAWSWLRIIQLCCTQEGTRTGMGVYRKWRLRSYTEIKETVESPIDPAHGRSRPADILTRVSCPAEELMSNVERRASQHESPQAPSLLSAHDRSQGEIVTDDHGLDGGWQWRPAALCGALYLLLAVAVFGFAASAGLEPDWLDNARPT